MTKYQIPNTKEWANDRGVAKIFRFAVLKALGLLRCSKKVLAIHSCSMHSGFMIPKELVAASAEPLVLWLLERQGESYGYAIIQEVKARSDQRLQWTDGMLYPVLHRMEATGLIKSRWGESETGRRRKYYSLKAEGRKAGKKHREQWLSVHSVLAGLWEEKYV